MFKLHATDYYLHAVQNWPHRLTVRTQASHACNRSSILREVTHTKTSLKHLALSYFCVWPHSKWPASLTWRIDGRSYVLVATKTSERRPASPTSDGEEELVGDSPWGHINKNTQVLPVYFCWQWSIEANHLRGLRENWIRGRETTSSKARSFVTDSPWGRRIWYYWKIIPS